MVLVLYFKSKLYLKLYNNLFDILFFLIYYNTYYTSLYVNKLDSQTFTYFMISSNTFLLSLN